MMILLLASLTWWILTVSIVAFMDNTIQNITVVLMLERKNTSLLDESHFRPAFDIALNRVNNGHYSFHVNTVFRDSGEHCAQNGMNASAITAQLLLDPSLNISAFFGPICYVEASAVADLTAYWNVPIFTVYETNPELVNKNRYKTLVRMTYARGEVVDFISHIFEDFSWTHACVMLQNGRDIEWLDLVESIQNHFEHLRYGFEKVVISDYDDLSTPLVTCTKSARSEY